MAINKTLLAAALLAPAVLAQQGAWQQCGGINWTGGTSCVSGYTCVKQNDYYSQCIPGNQATTTQRPTTMTTTTRPTTSNPGGTTTRPGSSVTAAPSGNPFSGYQMYANPYYASEILTLAVPSLPASLAAKASAVAKVPTFMWMDTASKVPLFETFVKDITDKNAAGASPPYIGTFVVYDLPDRDCAAAASNGEYSIANGGVANYKAYIDSIAAVVKKYPNTKIVFVIEPDSLANLVTNLNVSKCSNAQSAYLECTRYALTQLNLPNVSMYLDAGHAGWLGWSANLQPAADLFNRVYADAGRPASVRGLATNVANYNAWSISSPPSYTQGNSNYDEKHYIAALAPLLSNGGFPAHFIVDQGRSGKQPTGQSAWGEWCNQIGTGFGIRPTSNTGEAAVDAFVWVKPGGECDGTSDTSAARYDVHCGSSSSLKPAPEAGSWFEAYFEQLLTNANPAF